MEIKEVKDLRKKLGWTQTELAGRAGVSQSMIAKMEAGLLEPAYSNAMKIFDALQEEDTRKQVKAEELMNRKVVSIRPDSTIKQAIASMKKNAFSQLPVMEDERVVGMISESLLLDAMLDEKSRTVCEIMEDAPPIIAPETPLQAITELLKHYPIILVSKKGKMLGLITKTDLLDNLYLKR